MYDAVFVRLRETRCDLQRNRDGLCESERRRAPKPIFERLALIERHRDEKLPVRGLAG